MIAVARRFFMLGLAAALLCIVTPAPAQTSIPTLELSEMRDDLALVLPALCYLAGGQGMVPDGVLVSPEARGLDRQWNAPENFVCSGISVLADRPLDPADQTYREIGVQLLFSAPDGRVAVATVLADVLVTPSFVWITRAVAKPGVPPGKQLRFFVLMGKEGVGAGALSRLNYPELVALLIERAIEPGSPDAPEAGSVHPATIVALELARSEDAEPLPTIGGDAPHRIGERKSWSLDGWRITAVSGEFVFGDRGAPLRLQAAPGPLLEIVP